jgi:hypothetical protein
MELVAIWGIARGASPNPAPFRFGTARRRKKVGSPGSDGSLSVAWGAMGKARWFSHQNILWMG